MSPITPELRREFAPTGTLRVGINLSNFLLTRTEPNGEHRGIAVDLGRELGARLGLPVEGVAYPNPGALADAAAGAWDGGFLRAEPQRAQPIDFTPAYVEIEATYLVPADSPVLSIADVDRPGVRVAISARSAYDLFLTRHLQQAELMRAE